jgi:hypothetical protein
MAGVDNLLIQGDDVRSHPNIGIQSAINRALEVLPADLEKDVKGAFIQVEVEDGDQASVDVMAYAKLDKGWSFGLGANFAPGRCRAAGCEARHDGTRTYKAQVLKVWK